MATLTKGSKVYIDGFGGLIAGIVVEMVPRSETTILGCRGACSGATVKVTAPTGRGYVRGEFVTRPVSMVVPRECVRRRKYGTRILPYTTVV